MKISELESGQGKIDIEVEIVELEEPKEFNKFGSTGKLCKGKAKDESGEITVTFWNEQCDLVKKGDKIHIINGWCSEYQGEKQLGTGKFGRLEIVKSE